MRRFSEKGEERERRKGEAQSQKENEMGERNRLTPFTRIFPFTDPKFFLPERISRRVDFPEKESINVERIIKSYRSLVQLIS